MGDAAGSGGSGNPEEPGLRAKMNTWGPLSFTTSQKRQRLGGGGVAEGLLFSVRGVSVPREALHAQDETASHASAVGPGSLKGKSEAGEALSKPGIPVGGSGRSLKHQVGRTRQTARW